SPNRCFVRFWPKADMSECTAHVRLWPLADIEDWAVRTLYRNGTQPSGPRRMHTQSIEQFRHFSWCSTARWMACDQIATATFMPKFHFSPLTLINPERALTRAGESGGRLCAKPKTVGR